jgi:DNA-directed RNA polymerase, subunit K/omega
MLKPAMYQIIDKHDSYYEFVVAVAQCARNIAEESERNHVILVEKPVKLAVEEFSSGRARVEDYI